MPLSMGTQALSQPVSSDTSTSPHASINYTNASSTKMHEKVSLARRFSISSLISNSHHNSSSKGSSTLSLPLSSPVNEGQALSPSSSFIDSSDTPDTGSSTLLPSYSYQCLSSFSSKNALASDQISIAPSEAHSAYTTNRPHQENHDLHPALSVKKSKRPSRKLSMTGAALPRKSKGEWYEEFKYLDSEYHRFASKTGVNKANVLRLALLPFLRQQRGEFVKISVEETMKRVRILQKWWVGILASLRDRERPVSGSDRSAYLEAVSGLVARNEWSQVTDSVRAEFRSLICDTLRYVVAKLSLKTVPITFAAFAGKILAYAFFHAPGVAQVLLHLLGPSKSDIDRITKGSFSNVSPQYTDLDNAAELVRDSFPSHIGQLIACTSLPKQPSAPPQVHELYGPWARRWTAFNSDVFNSFFKHYYSIISSLLPAELPWNAHLAAPGLIIIHSYLLRTLDSTVHLKRDISRYVCLLLSFRYLF